MLDGCNPAPEGQVSVPTLGLAMCNIQAVIAVDQPRETNVFTSTELLVRSNHPINQSGWPAWAVVSFIHLLGDGPDSDKDLYVTYASSSETVADHAARSELCGVKATPIALYHWDWGPTECDLSVIFVARQNEFATAPGFLTEAEERTVASGV